jgi:hypothetical protein
MNPSSNPSALLMRGMSFGYLARRGYYSSPEGLAQVDAMAEIGVRWVALMVSVMQDTFYSTRLYQDVEFTPSDHELEQIIARFHSRGIKVMLKPMVECHDSAWRGHINFPDDDQQIQGRRTNYWDPWFDSLAQNVAHYGALAERSHCDSYCIGCELFAAEQAAHNARWTRVVAAARANYRGSICYDVQPPTLLETDSPPEWLNALDAVCISYYTPCAKRIGASVEEMMAGMAPTLEKLRAVSAMLGGKPVIFGETGCRSVTGAAMNPSEFRTSGAYSPEEQANYLEAMCRTFWAESWWGGFFWWKWEEQQDRPHYSCDLAGDTGFTLRNKPAADILQKWFKSPQRA